MSGHHCVVEDKKADAVTHLALARSQNTGNGISGETKDESSHESGCLFLYFWKVVILDIFLMA